MKSHRRLFIGFGLTALLAVGSGPAAAETTLMWTQYTSRDWGQSHYTDVTPNVVPLSMLVLPSRIHQPAGVA